MEGLGPLKGAEETAEEHLLKHRDAERAIDRVIATHVRVVGATGFATGVGGAITPARGVRVTLVLECTADNPDYNWMVTPFAGVNAERLCWPGPPRPVGAALHAKICISKRCSNAVS